MRSQPDRFRSRATRREKRTPARIRIRFPGRRGQRQSLPSQSLSPEAGSPAAGIRLPLPRRRLSPTGSDRERRCPPAARRRSQGRLHGSRPVRNDFQGPDPARETDFLALLEDRNDFQAPDRGPGIDWQDRPGHGSQAPARSCCRDRRLQARSGSPGRLEARTDSPVLPEGRNDCQVLPEARTGSQVRDQSCCRAPLVGPRPEIGSRAPPDPVRSGFQADGRSDCRSRQDPPSRGPWRPWSLPRRPPALRR